jgi:hypothetical protein
MPDAFTKRWRVRGTLALLMVFSAVAAAPQPARAETIEAKDRVMAGIYANDQWNSSDHIAAINSASGKALSIGGLWFHLDDSALVIDHLLEEVWSAGATPFANIHVQSTASRVAAGDLDGAIQNLVAAVKGWVDRGGGRSVLLAPMQEMNGDWIPYGMDPTNYKPAFRRFVNIGRAAGLADTNTRWVFAPNGWSKPPHKIVDYYPGPDYVDLIGISAYNWGGSTVYQTMGGALNELRSFAPEKPYIVAQTASTTAGGDRDAWLREMFAFLAADTNAVGFIYFDIDKETDWSIYRNGQLAPGFVDGMQRPTTIHQFPLSDWFQPGPLLVPLVWQGTFADDDQSPFQADIEWLYQQGITLGCDTNRFCPTAGVSREQMASFIARALALPSADTDYFSDDDGNPHEADINRVRAAGITVGCSATSYCPKAMTTREQMASFLTRALKLAAANVDYFGDDTGSVHEEDINSLRQAQVTVGCGAETFCPTKTVSREEMAAFLHRALE